MTTDCWGWAFIVGVLGVVILWWRSKGKDLPSSPNDGGD